MFTLKKILPVAFFLAGAGSLAQADEKSIQAAVEKFIDAPAVVSVQELQYGDLYEVVLQGGQILYTDEKVNFLIDGRIIDTASRTDLTRARMDDLNRIDIDELPLKHAIKTVKGDGSRFLVTFEDPMCGFCKKLQKEIEGIDNVTVYTFLYPVLGAPSASMSDYIWCAKDREQVWLDWMLKGDKPKEATCDNKDVIEQNLEMGQKMGIHGTPALFFADGRRVGGFIPKERIESVFDEIEAAKKAAG